MILLNTYSIKKRVFANDTMHIKKLLLITLFCFDISAACPTFTPQNTEIHFDLDETIIEKDHYKLCWTTLQKNRFRVDQLYPFARNVIQPVGCIIGHPWNLISKGIANANLRKYINPILKLVAEAHTLLPGITTVLQRLKEKKYPIVYATNKDPISYYKVAEFLGTPFSEFPSRVIVSFPDTSSDIAQEWKQYLDDPKNPNDGFKQLVTMIYNLKPTDRMKYSPDLKPAPGFARTQRQFAGDKNIIFFDDKGENIETAGNDSNIYGFQSFKSPTTIAHALFELGVFSIDDPQDRALLEELKKISNPTSIVATIQNWWGTINKRISPPKVTPAVIKFRKENCSGKIAVKNVTPAVS